MAKAAVCTVLADSVFFELPADWLGAISLACVFSFTLAFTFAFALTVSKGTLLMILAIITSLGTMEGRGLSCSSSC